MPEQARLGDRVQIPADVHGCPNCAHSAIGPALTGSADTLVNGRPALRLNDSGILAGCCGPNRWQANRGSSSVLINGLPAHRLGDTVSHSGGTGQTIEGSPNVFVGDDCSTPGSFEWAAEPSSSDDTESSVRDKLVMFFRSEGQAAGLPQGDPTTGNVTRDEMYDQSFGFDLYRPDLYGTHECIFIDVNKGKIFDSNMAIEDQYEESKTILNLELMNKKGETRYVDATFKLVKNGPFYHNKYYLPNILIMPGRTVKIYAKYFGFQKKVTASISISNTEGIESFTRVVTFSKPDDVEPIEIKTSDKFIPSDTILTISAQCGPDDALVEKVIGECRLVRNQALEARYLFIETLYNGAASKGADYSELVAKLCKKALNQAGIQIICIDCTSHLSLMPEDGIPGQADKLRDIIDSTNTINDIDKLLHIVTDKYFRGFSVKLLSNIEHELRELLVEKQSMIEDKSSLKTILDEAGQSYDKSISALIDFFKQMRLNIFPAFVCTNLSPLEDPVDHTRTVALAFPAQRGIIITSQADSDPMACAHELGHNFALLHTFNQAGKPGKPDKPGNLYLPIYSTKENIMDYHVTPSTATEEKTPNPSQAFIKFQWDIMRDFLQDLTCQVSDLNISSIVSQNGHQLLCDNACNYADGNYPSMNYVNKLNYHYLWNFTLALQRALDKYWDSRGIAQRPDAQDKTECQVLKVVSRQLSITLKKLAHLS